MDHFLIGQLLSASFLGPAGLTSVCFPSHTPVSYHISADTFIHSYDKDVCRVIMHGTGSCGRAFTSCTCNLRWQQKEIPLNMYNLTTPDFQISVFVVFHLDPLIYSLFSLLSLSLYLPLCVSLTMLKAIVALKPSETLEESTGGVESHPAACGL